MTTTQQSAIERHGRNLLAIFPNATEKDPVKLCKKLRRLEAEASRYTLMLCNGDYATGSQSVVEERIKAILPKVNALLGNVRRPYQPKTGSRCSCKRGVERDNCAACEGTGHCIDFAAIRNANKLPGPARDLVPVFINRDPRGYALKIDEEWMRARPTRISSNGETYPLHTDWGGYGILAPEIGKDGE